MPKIKKLNKHKRYQFNVNRKRMAKKRNVQIKNIKCKELRDEWEKHKTVGKNMKEMGLSMDPNKSLGLPSRKQDRLQFVSKLMLEEDPEAINNLVKPEKPKRPAKKQHVADELEKKSKEFKGTHFQYPKGVVNVLKYFMGKYGLKYKQMVKDQKNHEQWTWKQFRSKIRKLIDIPDQFNPIVKELNYVKNDLRWKEDGSDDDDIF